MDYVLRQKKHFEKISKTYRLSRQHANHLLFKELLWEYFLKGVPFPSKRLDVLEPMCGYAEGKSILEKYGGLDINYTGFDYSEPFVEHVRATEPSANVFLMDVTAFKTDRRYDLVILLGGMHHVPRHVLSVIGRMHEVLKDGGFFISLEPTQNNTVFRKIREAIYHQNSLFDSETEQAFDLLDLNAHFIKNGFRLVRQIYPGLLAYVLYYNPDAFPWLNVGGRMTVTSIFNIEKAFYASVLGRRLSFATLSLWQKPAPSSCSAAGCT